MGESCRRGRFEKSISSVKAELRRSAVLERILGVRSPPFHFFSSAGPRCDLADRDGEQSRSLDSLRAFGL